MSKPPTGTPTAPASPARRSYRVLRDGYVAGRRRKKGDLVELTEAEAKYEDLTHVDGMVAPSGKGAAKS